MTVTLTVIYFVGMTFYAFNASEYVDELSSGDNPKGVRLSPIGAHLLVAACVAAWPLILGAGIVAKLAAWRR